MAVYGHMTVFVVPSRSFSNSSFKTYIQDSMLGTTTSLGTRPLNRYCTPSSCAMLSISLQQEVFLTPADIIILAQSSHNYLDLWKIQHP